ncbi:hypothetical protein CPB83DRAFT_890481 [Crepidotus variabilis]|uniref:Uncharacterized protein n=1 Tax=Crepidotus variabilis TaxID=179855 RepID=A0A9P6EN43_9AGAR|nr:hypothetical protein CPB83DRAFT_890481 [Crepidotus variabilis]
MSFPPTTVQPPFPRVTVQRLNTTTITSAACPTMRSSSPIETEYSIDYTAITTTTTTTKGARSTSPLHFLYPIMPTSSSSTSSPTRSPSSSSSHNPHTHSLNSSHHTYSPGGKRSAKRKAREQQEIARLLDPSYQDSTSSAARRSLEVYVDKDGDLHDPDFRYFPSADSFVSRTKRDVERGGGMRSRRATSPRRGDRPYWDRTRGAGVSANGDDGENENESALADEEEEEAMAMALAMESGQNDFLTRVGYGNVLSGEYSPRSRRSGRSMSMNSNAYSHSYAYAYPRGPTYSSGYSYSSSGSGATTTSSTSATTTTTPSTTTNNTSYHSPTMTTTTLPTSYESEEHTPLSLSSSAEQEGEKCGVKGLLAAAKRRRRFSKGDKDKKEKEEKADEAKEFRELRRSIEASRTSVLQEEECVIVEEKPFITVVSDPSPSPSPSHSALPLPSPKTSPIAIIAKLEADTCPSFPEDEEDIEEPTHTEYTPTCTQVLKGHWLSISLRIRFGVYRAQRRFVRRVNSMF